MKAYDISTSPAGLLKEGDKKAKTRLGEVLSLAGGQGMGKGFDEADFFAGEDSGVCAIFLSIQANPLTFKQILKEQFKSHFRNVSRIMDCVGCDKCRLWGKLQVSGIGTALKILFELDDKALEYVPPLVRSSNVANPYGSPKINPDLLQRSEVVALFNTLHRISESLASVEQFRQIYAATQKAETEASKVKAVKTARKKHSPSPMTPPPAFSLTNIQRITARMWEKLGRNCKGCLEVCLQTLESGKLGELATSFRRWVGGIGEDRDL